MKIMLWKMGTMMQVLALFLVIASLGEGTMGLFTVVLLSAALCGGIRWTYQRGEACERRAARMAARRRRAARAARAAAASRAVPAPAPARAPLRAARPCRAGMARRAA